MYPHLTETLEFLFADNYGLMRNKVVKHDTEWVWPENVRQLEEQASLLTPAEKDALACGEYEQAQRIVEMHCCAELADFLEGVFDGDLTFNFCRR